MIGDVEWENVNIAGAFVLGAILGTLATIRIMRLVLVAYRRETGEVSPRRRRHIEPTEADDADS